MAWLGSSRSRCSWWPCCRIGLRAGGVHSDPGGDGHRRRRDAATRRHDVRGRAQSGAGRRHDDVRDPLLRTDARSRAVRSAGARPAVVRRWRPASPVCHQRGAADVGGARRRRRHDLPHFDHGVATGASADGRAPGRSSGHPRPCRRRHEHPAVGRTDGPRDDRAPRGCRPGLSSALAGDAGRAAVGVDRRLSARTARTPPARRHGG